MADKTETPKAEKPKLEGRALFVSKAEKATTAALKSLGNVAKIPAKERTDADVTAIVGALRQAVDFVEARLKSGASDGPTFKL